LLTRDYRSWIYSRHSEKKGLALKWSLRWFAENKKIENRLKKMGLDIFYVGYEELCLYPEFILKKLCN